MSKKIQRIPYTLEVTLATGESYLFNSGENVECRIEKQTDPLWNAEVMYTSASDPTVLTYEATGIETSDTALKFSIFNDTDRLSLKNNTVSSISLYVTRKA